MTASLPVLAYQGFPEEPGARDGPQVPLTQFRMHLTTLLADGWELLGLTEALVALDTDPSRRVVGITIDDGYADFAAAAMVLADLGARATFYVPTDMVDTDGYLNWDELRVLDAYGVEIGSHACRHRPMDTLRSTAVAEEVVVSRAELTTRLGVEVRSFCYPYGYSSRRVRRMVANAGYTSACVIGHRVARSSDDRFAVPRLQPVPDMTAGEIRRMVRSGEPGLGLVAKRVLQPAWRMARLASGRLLGQELT
jgi:peptidoglycan/xylan/chitin deacetylase (PgdA/CDA1 family)